ncbi:MAG TPA: ATP-binding protein, partial [Longimicrobiaceae bacterium]|nr:ATP-binding protein [Longimicrobiaceae bacterium]
MPRLPSHAPPGTAAHDLVQQRERIARVLLGSVAALGLVAYIPSIWLSAQVGAWAIAALDTVAYATIVAAFLYPRAGYRARAGVLIGVSYALGLLLTLRFGPVSAGPLWLCAVPVLTAVLFDRRATVAALFLTLAALLAAMLVAHLRPGLWSATVPGMMGLLAVIASNLVLLATGLALAVSALVRGLRGSAERAEELAAELVAERLRLEDSNERLQAEMSEHAAAEARLRQAEKLTALGTLAGGIAHNLNNLLTPILMGVELMRSEKSVDDELLDRMQEAAVGARQVVRQVLTFSRALPDARVPLDAAEAFGEAVALLRASLPPRVELQTRFAPELGAVSLAPADAHQIVLNLGSNAQQAMPEGGRLTLTADVVHGVAPGLDPQREYLCLGVRDTGVGMDAETLARASEPFFTTKTAGQGTGLGLATVHGIVMQSGGFITVTSEPGRGTTFEVALPEAPESATPVETATTSV